jgi:hypothetical protein
MTDGFPNKPKILRGAFVEFGLSLPPLVVVFQFNPLQLSRNRTLSFAIPGKPSKQTLREHHAGISNLLELRDNQAVTVAEQTIGFEIRLDATDKLDEGDAIAQRYGIAPQIATLELMVLPKSESQVGSLADQLGKSEGFSFTKVSNPPLVLFIFGRKRVLPVNINSMNITETEFSTDLNPLRATVAVNLTVLEGPNKPYRYSRAVVEAMSMINLANITDVANVAVPG